MGTSFLPARSKIGVGYHVAEYTIQWLMFLFCRFMCKCATRRHNIYLQALVINICSYRHKVKKHEVPATVPQHVLYVLPLLFTIQLFVDFSCIIANCTWTNPFNSLCPTVCMGAVTTDQIARQHFPSRWKFHLAINTSRHNTMMQHWY